MRKSSKDGHILISGTGRTGTTLLVKYFTALGFDTGFSIEDTTRVRNVISNAGLEFPGEPRPYVIKSPYTEPLGALVDRRAFKIKCCIVPIRCLFDAAASRRRVYREAKQEGKDPIAYPGSIWVNSDPTDPHQQESVLAIRFYKLIEALTRHAVPTYFLHFPTFVESADDIYDRLKPILDEHEVSQIESKIAFQSVVDPHLVHKFTPE